MQGKLYLIPTPISDEAVISTETADIRSVVAEIRYFAVENIRTARRFIRSIDKSINIDELIFFDIGKNVADNVKEIITEQIKSGNDVGLMSEAGVPCIADPGSEIVLAAHMANIEVIPLVGVSSIFLALMGSGLNGQKFMFNGYLPINKHERQKTIKNLEKASGLNRQTQIFIETPYRNSALFQDLIKVCMPNTLLTIAIDLTSKSQILKTRTILNWQNEGCEFQKQPAIFALQAQ